MLQVDLVFITVKIITIKEYLVTIAKFVKASVYGTLLTIGLSGSLAYGLDSSANVAPEQIQGNGYRLEQAYLVETHVPNANVESVLSALVAAVSLEYGDKYDQVLFLDAPGFEHFRPKSNSKGGEHKTALRDPSTRVTFSIPQDSTLLKNAIDAIHKAHSYEEPVVYIKDVWRSQALSADDDNPNRWWNKNKSE
ncbi:hypothetical protein [Candidatus Albibeggiatoa sp. nov. NOAA]|uniref:hypothetical protein n=1 Tax=Candidatus Albibeggiatoa sp. nov. NOAA TaxID=3162724 RepID=UPI0032FB015A|nr:hypothetical protein [Thiotrichaceae bacterium]